MATTGRPASKAEAMLRKLGPLEGPRPSSLASDEPSAEPALPSAPPLRMPEAPSPAAPPAVSSEGGSSALELRTVPKEPAPSPNGGPAGTVELAPAKRGEEAQRSLEALRAQRGAHLSQVQLVVSEGLSAPAISDPGHLQPFLDTIRAALAKSGVDVAPELIVLENGRVRAGYAVGEALFGDAAGGKRAVVHLIGERPGTMHHQYSAYIAALDPGVWSGKDGRRCDHDLVRVVAGIADTALDPSDAAKIVADHLAVELGKTPAP